MSSNLKKQFENDGYIIIRKFIDDNTIRVLREKFNNSEDKTKYLGYDSWSEYDDFISKILSNKKLEILKEIYDEPIIYPDFVTQLSNSPKSLMKPHWDLQSFIRYNKMSKIKNINYSKVGLYLQDSDEDISGAIHYVPKSHKSFFYSISRPRRFISYLNSLRKNFLRKKQVVMKLKAGDMAIFDGRLLHSSSPKKGNLKKISFYMSLLGDKKSLQSYLTNEIIRMSEDINNKKPNTDQRIEYIFSKDKIKNLQKISTIPIFIINQENILNLKYL